MRIKVNFNAFKGKLQLNKKYYIRRQNENIKVSAKGRH
jgi:hypothetical protein